MIGDRESGEIDPSPEESEGFGPLDAMVRFDPPGPGLDLVWVERYGQLVLTRYGGPDGVTSETVYPTQARATQEVAYRTSSLTSRGYRVVVDDFNDRV